MTKDTDINDNESIDIHGVRNKFKWNYFVLEVKPAIEAHYITPTYGLKNVLGW
jgi:hypothetical protein